jgi:tetratricopeptide (TPR) repeat protein
MERNNDVPTDITRRRVIADLLGIPYALLGLGESLAKKSLMVDAPKVLMIPKQETLAQEVLEEHQQSLTLYFAGYYHRHGQAALDDIAIATQQLSTAVSQTRERAKPIGIALISRYHQFGINVAREQQNYKLALFHADKAIEYAEEVHKIKPNSDLMAVTQLRRSLASFEQAITRVRQDGNLDDAIVHIDAALSYSQQAMPLIKKGFSPPQTAAASAQAVRRSGFNHCLL